MKLRKLNLEELPPVMLALSGVLGIGPMAVYRFVVGDYAVALVDLIATLGFLAIAWSVYAKGAVRAASVCMAFLAISAVVASVTLKGGGQTVWMYPAIVALFYLLQPKEAALTALISILVILPTVSETRTLGQMAVYLASLGVTISLSVAFSALTNEQRRELQARSLIDSLTGIGNRRALDAALDEAIAEVQVGGDSFVLIMLDIDHFKDVNDSHGHAVGDEVLCEVADALQGNLRAEDVCFRAGGEEFVVLARTSELRQAVKLAERLRVAISSLRHECTNEAGEFGVTASFGLAEYLEGEGRDSLYKRADDALYDAKRSGRNRLHLSERTVSLSGTASHVVSEALLEETLAGDPKESNGRLSEAS